MITTYFCKKGDPYANTKWGEREITINKKTMVVEAPISWSDLAVKIVASKYFAKEENSVKQLIDRVVKFLSIKGLERGYFNEKEAQIFANELAWLCVNQYGAFNSPVWFNVGIKEAYGRAGSPHNYYYDEGKGKALRCLDTYSYPQASACFIQSVQDNMDDIMRLAKSEAMLFKHGSGTGTNLSTIRSSREQVTGGGTASGPISFMRIFNEIAGVVKSGGISRRAAMMRVLNTDHPDILAFTNCKVKEERKAQALIAQGYDGSFDGEAYDSIQYQNANNSVRATDAFMKAVKNDEMWNTYSVVNRQPVETMKARKIFEDICEATRLCGDPGMQFDDTINSWHTCKVDGRINASNPCLAKGTRLRTSRGWECVENLADTPVQIFDGNDFTTGKVWKTGHKDVITLKTRTGHTITVTPDHKIMTDNGWVEAKDCLNHLIKTTNFVKSGTDTLVPVTRDMSKIKEAPMQFTEELMIALGFIFGDGNVNTDGRLSIYYTPTKDKAFIEEKVLPILAKIAGKKGEDFTSIVHPIDERSYLISRKKLTLWLEQIGWSFEKLTNRQLPPFIYTVNETLLRSFLRGLFAANGNIIKSMKNDKVVRSAILLVSTNKQMLQNIQILLQSLGVRGNVRVHNKAVKTQWQDGKCYTSKESYHLEITHQCDINTFAEKIGFPQKTQHDKLQKIIDPCKNAITTRNKKYREYAEVISIETAGTMDVYDFSCPTTHAGIANGIVVHNCSEFMFLDDSACNLASLNLSKFFDGNTLCKERLQRAAEVFIAAQDILVNAGSYPEKNIAENSNAYRPLGLGYCDLGAVLMKQGIPYDSKAGIDLCGQITSYLTAYAYLMSSKLAKKLGTFKEFERNRQPMLSVIARHRDAAITNGTEAIWDEVYKAGLVAGYRNAQVTVLAPTGTIGFMMDCSTTGIEPELALLKYKTVVGGDTLTLVNTSVIDALKALGYEDEIIASISKHINDTGTIEGSRIKPEHLPVFDCAFKSNKGTRVLSWEAHINMMVAAQPFLSGAISKTVNMPEGAAKADIEKVYMTAWERGLKAVAVFVDGCKANQPLKTTKTQAKLKNGRRELPDTRQSITHKFQVGDHRGYLTVGLYEDGKPGELFINISKEGSLVHGVLDALATQVSISLQYGVPLKMVVNKFLFTSFEPKGMTRHKDIKFASSILDYIGKWLKYEFLDNEKKDEKGLKMNMPIKTCPECGAIATPNGSCYRCDSCGTSLGCS